MVPYPWRPPLRVWLRFLLAGLVGWVCAILLCRWLASLW